MKLDCEPGSSNTLHWRSLFSLSKIITRAVDSKISDWSHVTSVAAHVDDCSSLFALGLGADLASPKCNNVLWRLSHSRQLPALHWKA